MKICPEDLNNWRIVPRLMLILYGYVFWIVVNWFMGLESPTNAQAMFVSTIVGVASAFFGLYVNSGSIVQKKKETKKTDTAKKITEDFLHE